MHNEHLASEQTYKTLVIIWLALFMSQFIFLAIIYFVNPELYNLDFSKSPFGEFPPFIFAAAFVGISNLVFSFILRNKYVKKAIEIQNPNLVQTGVIIGLAICESISLFGFVLAFAFDFQYFFLWFALGILGMIFHFPKRENLHLATYKTTQKF